MGVLEHLIPNDWETVRRNFERLERLFSLASKDSDGFGFTVAGIGTRFGTSTATWTAAAKSANKTVAHGLGKTPSNIQLTPYNDIAFEIVSKDATNIVVVGLYLSGNVGVTTLTGTFSFDWQVIG